jgi:hypothetical protein
MRKSWLIASFSLLALVTGSAQSVSINTCTNKQTLVFSNGVWNTSADWEKALHQTTKAFTAQNKKFSGAVNFAHPSESVGQDMLETFLQKSREPAYNGLTVEQKMAAFMRLTTKELNSGTMGSHIAEMFNGLRTDWNKLVEENSAASLLALAQKNIDAATSKDYAVARTHLMNGNRLLVVAHSQGNLYANGVLRKLFADQSLKSLSNNIKMVGVAVPASSVTDPLGQGSTASADYVTRDDDGVINRLRVKAQESGAAAPLAWNAAHSLGSDMLGLGHRYIEGYLNGRGLPSQMLKDRLNAAYDFLANQDPTRVAFSLRLNFDFPQTAAAKTALDNYLSLGNENLNGENGLFVSSTLTRPTPYSVQVAANYYCRTLDNMAVDQVMSLPLGMEFAGNVPAPLIVGSRIEAMGVTSSAYLGAPSSVPADSTGSVFYYQGTAAWKKMVNGASLTNL